MSRAKPWNVEQIIADTIAAEEKWLQELEAEYIALRKSRPTHHYVEDWDDWD